MTGSSKEVCYASASADAKLQNGTEVAIYLAAYNIPPVGEPEVLLDVLRPEELRLAKGVTETGWDTARENGTFTLHINEDILLPKGRGIGSKSVRFRPVSRQHALPISFVQALFRFVLRSCLRRWFNSPPKVTERGKGI